MRIGIVGAGLQAKRRAPVIAQMPDMKLKVISSEHVESSKSLANSFHCESEVGWEWVGKRDDLDVILVCTPPHLHAQISILAMQTGKHVLCEKPLARTINECKQMIAVSKQTVKLLKCGFNHRHHPGILDAKKDIEEGKIGKPLFIRSRYGIIGQPSRKNEWRFNPSQASGGHLMEQGIHAIDLARWFLGEFDQVLCFRDSQYWGSSPLEDNAFLTMRTETGLVASIHTSLLQWKNLFSFEIFGEDGFFEIEGLGGSYGTEKLNFCPKKYNAPFEIHTREYRGADKSWKLEWLEFIDAIKKGRTPLGSAEDGLAAMQLVFDAYKFSDSIQRKSEMASKGI
jgi:predicted dehydrogenase